MKGRKILVLLTLLAVLAAFTALLRLEKPKELEAVSWNTSKFVAIGKAAAPIEILVVEDLKCHNCRVFSETIIPKLHSHYIQTGRARFVFVPVAFLYGSKPLANAALEVYLHYPSRFFKFLEAVLAHAHEGGDLRQKDLIRIARRIEGIDLEKLQTCIEIGCHNNKLQENYDWAQSAMGGQFKTPALFINGKRVSTTSYEEIQKEIGK